MKRATLTPNRFTTFTRSWPVKGFVLFIGLVLLGSCIDEASLVGYRKDPRFEVKFKEFKIPVHTVQADSIRTGYIDATLSGADKLMCGTIDDPLFGKISSTIFSQFVPTVSTKMVAAGRTNFQPIKLTLNMVLDYYVYGDTLYTPSTYKLYRLASDMNISRVTDYVTNSSEILGTELASSTYNYRPDSVRSHIKKNTDTNVTNNLYDSLYFEINDNNQLAKQLLDSARGVGGPGLFSPYPSKPDSLVFDGYKTDSVFVNALKGIAIVPVSGSRVLGFRTGIGASISATSRLTLYYSYEEDGETKTAQLYYFLDGSTGDAFSFPLVKYTSTAVDRNSTALAAQPGLPIGTGATVRYNDFTAPDNFCYVQAGTGLYGKLDFTAVRDTFNTVGTVAVISAELVIGLESPITRPHINQPNGLYIRMVKNNNRFYLPPKITALDSKGNVIKNIDGTPYLISDPSYAAAFYCTSNDSYLDVRGDGNLTDINGIANLTPTKDGRQYRGYITEYLEYHTRLPAGKPRLDYLGLIPSHTSIISHLDYRTFGKFLNGVSFHKDSVKLRVFYSIPK